MYNVEKRRQTAFENSQNPWISEYQEYIKCKTVLEVSKDLPHNLKRAEVEYNILSNYPCVVNDEELLVGRYSTDIILTDEEHKTLEEGRKYLQKEGILAGFDSNSTGHRVIDYETLLNYGIANILKDIENYLKDDPKNVFYLSVKKSLKGLINIFERYKILLTQKVEDEKKLERKNELQLMLNNFSFSPLAPCKHFYEALQTMYLTQFAFRIIDDITLTGRLDNYLYPFYKNDIEKGIITKEFAFILIEELYFKTNEIYGTWPASLMVCGLKRNGEENFNELSEMCIEAIETTALINPAVSIAYTKNIPDEILKKSIDIIAKGFTKPAIFNDEIIRKGLIRAGMDQEDANYYIHSTCVEITPIGSSNVIVATPYININKAFEYIFGEKKAIYKGEIQIENDVDFDLEKIENFGEFYDLAIKVAEQIIDFQLKSVCDTQNLKTGYSSSPLASAFLKDCLKIGKDSGAGGAKYNYIYPCFPGFVNFIDSLSAIDKAVFKDKKLTLLDFSELIKSNFEKTPDILNYVKERCPKFANDIDDVDKIAIDVFDFLKETIKKQKTELNYSFHPSFFAWIMHGILGEICAATPDGRREGEALSENLGAVQGMDKNGPTAVMRSISKIDQSYGIGGIATNFRFEKNFIGSEKGKIALFYFIKTFMAEGNFEMQFNVIDKKDLQEAQIYPEKYKTLMVRVAGYSDYFVNLPCVIQNEIIKRSEHKNF